MGLGTFSELRVALLGVLLAALVGSYVYVHHEGYEACRAPEKAAQQAQKAKDATIDQGAISENQQAKGALVAPGGVASTPPPSLVLCRPSRLPARPAPATAGPTQPSPEGGDRGVLPGTTAEATVDVGPILQDFALAGVLRAAQGDELWERDVKQAQH